MAKHYRWFAISVATLCVTSILPAEQSAAANTLCVNPKGSKGCYSTISAGVAAANSGDTVRVGQGPLVGLRNEVDPLRGEQRGKGRVHVGARPAGEPQPQFAQAHELAGAERE